MVLSALSDISQEVCYSEDNRAVDFVAIAAVCIIFALAISRFSAGETNAFYGDLFVCRYAGRGENLIDGGAYTAGKGGASGLGCSDELYEDVQITHWTDIINVALDAHKRKRPCLVAVDEIQNTFDATDYKNFPVALYTLLTFNRKLELQFLCSSQIYDRTPSKIRALANYVVICKNVGKRDRLFRNYYFEKNNYESVFEGSRKKADFLRQYIADDELYASYDTFEQVQAVKGKAEDEKAMREYAMGLIFGGGDDADDAGGAAVHR